jgi:hypothetical protein
MHTSQAEYQSYLLRLWRTGARGAWRASLQNTATEQVIHFADIALLLTFLIAQTDESLSDRSADPPRAAERS